ncbi:SEL1-like repeat protein [uncultured Prevotella sp.]|uniref:tetratricopeptide repeat protein n=1 Tax=uncultured Prevotella sp. TaxID=159272 RepID=UPI002639C9D9|nr:SEL1-like repeat protein [uncultured Prevotella sp.]
MDKLKLTILFLFMSLAASAQRLAVESLKLRPNDLSARNVKNQRHDLNGKPCALLKVMVMDNITKCSSGNIGDIVTEGPVKLIYITSATPSIELSFQYHYPLTINFADYGYKHLEGNSTYELNLVDALQMMIGNGKKVEGSASQGNNVQPNANNTANVGGEPAVNDIAEMVKIADDAYKTKDYSKAMKWYLKAADKGNAHAQCQIGYMYNYAEGVTANYSTALKWYLKAANQGNTEAQRHIGYLYNAGRGVTQSFSKALQWLNKAVANGDVHALCDIGNMYGDRGDHSVAMKWFLKAAEQGDTNAMYKIGLMYELGSGVKKDLSIAMQWFLKAAEQGDARSQCMVGGMYSKGIGVTRDNAVARKWYLKAADQGYADAQANMGYMYYHGFGVSKDYSTAFKWYLKAAENGTNYAMFTVAEMYENGQGVEKNIDKAVYWYKKGAAKNHYDCKQALKRLGY